MLGWKLSKNYPVLDANVAKANSVTTSYSVKTSFWIVRKPACQQVFFVTVGHLISYIFSSHVGCAFDGLHMGVHLVHEGGPGIIGPIVKFPYYTGWVTMTVV